jgi:hypothetical protein
LVLVELDVTVLEDEGGEAEGKLVPSDFSLRFKIFIPEDQCLIHFYILFNASLFPTLNPWA